MKPLSVKSFLIILLSTLLISSCTKYEEGPLFSFKSKDKRLAAQWDLVKLNGVDVSWELDQLSYKFEENGTCIISHENEYEAYTEDATWGWKDNKKIIEIIIVYPDQTFKKQLKIYRLSDEQLWVEDEEMNEMEFAKEINLYSLEYIIDFVPLLFNKFKQ